jgi:hypothetical protein
MDGGMILALVIAIPVILFPAGLVWYLNISGIYTVLVETRKRRLARERRARAVEVKQ